MARALVLSYQLSDVQTDVIELTAQFALFGPDVPGGSQFYEGKGTVDIGGPVTAAAIAGAIRDAVRNGATTAGIVVGGGGGAGIIAPGFAVFPD